MENIEYQFLKNQNKKFEDIKQMRAISAPPGFSEFDSKQFIDQSDDQKEQMLRDPIYYEYYYSQKIIDSRLPKPLYKPPMEVNKLMLKQKEISFDYIQYIERQIKELQLLEPNKSDIVELNNKFQRVKLEKQNSRKVSFTSSQHKTSENQIYQQKSSLDDIKYDQMPFDKNLFQNTENNNQSIFQQQYFPPQQSTQKIFNTQKMQQIPFIQMQQNQMKPQINQSPIWCQPQIQNQYNFEYPQVPFYGYQQPMIPNQFQYFGQNFYKNQIDIENLTNVCQDQYGCNMIQQYLENATQAQQLEIFNKIKPQILNLSQDVFGNYIIQRFITNSQSVIVEQLIDIIKLNLQDICLSTYGCRVIQKAMEFIQDKYNFIDLLINELNQNSIRYIMDHNSSHIIQKCFELLPQNKTEILLNIVVKEADKFLQDPNGCRVIQKVIEFSPQEKIEPIIQKILERTVSLCFCQFGNYIMQHLIVKGSEQVRNQIFQDIKSSFVALSNNKFASNVMEKVIINCSNKYREEITDLLIIQDFNQQIGVFQMMNNPFGNYVVQRLLQENNSKNKLKICKMVTQQTQQYNDLKKMAYAKHVLNIIENIINKKVIM